MTRKIRIYSFTAILDGEIGTMSITARNADAAQQIRWDGHADMRYQCAGYVGGLPHFAGWATEVPGFYTAAQADADRRAKMPEIEHDPRDLAEFIAEKCRRPRRGAYLKRNMLNPDGGLIEVDHGTPSYCDPSCESYHTM